MTTDELFNTLDAMRAYDEGFLDSGIRDQVLKGKCLDHFESLDDSDLRFGLSRYLRDTYLSEEALVKGFGYEDVSAYMKWLGQNGFYI